MPRDQGEHGTTSRPAGGWPPPAAFEADPDSPEPDGPDPSDGFGQALARAAARRSAGTDADDGWLTSATQPADGDPAPARARTRRPAEDHAERSWSESGNAADSAEWREVADLSSPRGGKPRTVRCPEPDDPDGSANPQDSGIDRSDGASTPPTANRARGTDRRRSRPRTGPPDDTESVDGASAPSMGARRRGTDLRRRRPGTGQPSDPDGTASDLSMGDWERGADRRRRAGTGVPGDPDGTVSDLSVGDWERGADRRRRAGTGVPGDPDGTVSDLSVGDWERGADPWRRRLRTGPPDGTDGTEGASELSMGERGSGIEPRRRRLGAGAPDGTDDPEGASELSTGDRRPGTEPRRRRPRTGPPDDTEDPSTGDREGGARPRRGKSRAGDRAAGSKPEPDPVAKAKDVCLTLLTTRARTRSELAQALRRKGFDDDVTATVLGRLDEVGLIDDAAFADMWVQSRHTYQGLSGRALKVELQRKGVPDDVAAEALSTVDRDAEEQRARELVRKRLRAMTGVDDTVKVRRLLGMLARKGYSQGLAYSVVKDEVRAAGELLD